MKYTGVFFDLYGTLLSYGDMAAAWNDWLESLYDSLRKTTVPIDIETLRTACEGMFGLPEPDDTGQGLTVFERRMARLMRERLQLTVDNQFVQQAARCCVEAWQQQISLAPKALETLRILSADYRLALISNFDHPPHERRVLADTGLLEWFESIVISAEVGVKKPDPAIFQPALVGLSLKAHDVVYVGDTVEDVAAARAAGMTPVCIRRDRSGMGRVITDYRADNAEAVCETCALDQVDVETIASLSELPTLLRSGQLARGGTS